jgi:protoporphyrinogen oxidase
MSVAVIGGGVTGLTAAYLLLQRGTPVTIFEAASEEGGLAGTFKREGFSFDFGPHEFCTTNAVLERLLEEICGEDLLVVEKQVAQYLKGRYVRFPFQIADVLRNLSPGLCARALFDVLRARAGSLLRSSSEESFASWTRSHFGRTLYDLYFGPYTRKVWGVDPELLDARSAEQRISVGSFWELVHSTLRHQFTGRDVQDRTHSEIRRSFLYTRAGIGTLLTHLAQRVRELGGRFEFGKRWTGLETEGGAARRLHFADGSIVEPFDSVLSTIPLAQLTRLVLGEQGNSLLRDHPLPSRGMRFVFLRVDRPHVLDFHWAYYPEARIPFQRATEFGWFDADMTPAGQTGLTLEVACDPGEPWWDEPDETLVQECVQSLVRLGHLDPADVLGWDVVRVRHAYPVQVRGYAERVSTHVNALGAVDNLVTLGRQGLHRYCNMDECMEMALEVVPRLAQGERGIRCGFGETWQGVGLES